ncbi:MAG TPA: glycosyltransferase family 4 protein [Thermoanaerobaculia bacterium]|nr:glycosyltransferase family 4 protein [Thermoanaerobaculia bacterium]
MTPVLLVCPEPLGHRQPAGVGVRFLEMARTLRGDGHEVTVLTPDGGEVAGCRAEPLASGTIQRETARAGVAIVQGHAANDLFAHGAAIPTVVDLYDPFIIENLHYYGERGGEVFTHDHATLINSLVHGDFFLCASEAQRLFYLGLMLATGRVNPAAFDADPGLASLLAVAPFGVQPPIEDGAQDRPPAILFGGVYDWYDPILAIEAVAIARRSIPALTLTFTSHPNPSTTPQGKAAEAAAHARRNGYDDFVRFEPWVAYDDRARFFRRYSLALLTFPQSIETDLSMRTRVYDYLWGGLPVITSPAPGTDEILQRYDAGSIIRAGQPEAFATEIVTVLRDQPRYERLVSGASRFVRDHQWPNVLGPLREFCLEPRIDSTRDAFAVRLQVPEQAPSILDRLKRRIGGAF